MRRVLLVPLLIISISRLSAQIDLTIEGTEVIDTISGTSFGVNIPRKQPTNLTYRNNSITSINASGYMLQAGDETPGYFNNNLDGGVITGNKFIWNGTNENSTTHALFTGFNIDVVIKYNYLYRTPNGIQRKSDGMTDNSGVIAYNILNNPKVGIVVKGMNSVKIYNNTLYCANNPDQTTRGLIDIHTNTDDGLNAASTGTKVFNNIFYTKNITPNIKIYEISCLSDFESDYNLFWCEDGEPIFEVAGVTKTFSEWQVLGYDKHSTVINPNFINFTDFVPRERVSYGKNLGPSLSAGLATDAKWGIIGPRISYQNGTWQVGARIYEGSDMKIYIWPNPALNYFHVLLPSLSKSYQTLKIYDTGGRVILIKTVEQDLITVQIPENFATGIYNVSLEVDNLDRYVRKLLIIK